MNRINAHRFEKALKYVRRIRNAGKRAYAYAYLGFRNGTRTAPHESDFGIGIMARQAVRWQIDDLIEPTNE